MSKTGRAPTHWRRPITRTYDYNYSVGEHYYSPQLSYLETKRSGRAQTPPSAKTFAERFVENPIYGRTGDFNWRATTASSASSAEAESLGSAKAAAETTEKTLLNRYGSLDDLGNLLELRQKTEESLSSVNALRQSTAAAVKSSSTSVSSSNRKLKFVLGDRLLDAAGVDEEARTPKSALEESTDPLDIFLARRKNRIQSQAVAKSAEADLVTEDPFKISRNSAAMKAARQRADDMIEELNREAESSASRFRARLKAKAQDEQAREEAEFNVSRAEQIRERAKARLAQLELSFPGIAIGSEAVAKRAAEDEVFGNEFNSARMAGSTSISSRTVKITQRTVKSTVESN